MPDDLPSQSQIGIFRISNQTVAPQILIDNNWKLFSIYEYADKYIKQMEFLLHYYARAAKRWFCIQHLFDVASIK